MRRFVWFGLAACLFIAAAACSGPGGGLRGATPAGYIRPVANPAIEETAEPIAIADLLDTPETYEGQVIEVSGTYYQRQVVVCSTRPQRSPAGWSFSDGEARIPAGGTDERLENLPSGRIEITVIGRWLRWQGPVGCGRQAQITEVWYLEVLDVLSPNPITIAAVGSGNGGVTIQTEPPETEGGYPGPETETEDTQVTATPTEAGTMPELPGPVGTPVISSPTPSPTAGGGPNPTATPTVQTTAVTPSATPTQQAGGATPTPTSAAATSSPTSTTTASSSPAPTVPSGGGDGPVTVDQEELPINSLETGQLGANEIHRWPLVITSTAVITVNIASEIEMDAVIIIEGPSGDVVAQQNEAQGGEPEILAAVPLTEIGTYNILITGQSGEPGYYAILVLDDDEDSYTFVFNGTMEPGQSESTDIRASNDHFWHFFGTAGEEVTIRITPADNSDMFMRLFDVDGFFLVELHNEAGPGEVEELLSFTLPDTGFYSILVGEFFFNAATYSISLISG